MKQIVEFLLFLSCISLSPDLFADFDLSQSLSQAAKKFQAKYGNQPLTNHHLYNKSLDFLPSSHESHYRTMREEILKTIYEQGIDAIFHNKTGTNLANPLSLAALANDFSFVKFLLNHGGNPNQSQLLDGDKIVHPIQYAQTLEMVQLLEENGTDLSPLFNKNLSQEKDSRICEYVKKAKEKADK